METSSKLCPTCLKQKHFREFNKDCTNKDGLEYSCRDCRNTKRRQLYLKDHKKNKEKSKIKSKNFRTTRKDYCRNYDLKRNYGITSEDFDNMLKEQNSVCEICSRKNPNSKHNRFHVDHCHETGKVRGLLCSPCNLGLGAFGDNTEVLTEAIKYLKLSKGEIT
jgi:U3 small nucleolar RNA-associated protein 14